MPIRCVLLLLSVVLAGCAPFTPRGHEIPRMPETYSLEGTPEGLEGTPEGLEGTPEGLEGTSEGKSEAQNESERTAIAPLFSGGQWWHSLHSNELNALMTTALTEGFDIRTAWARLHQSEATARRAGAALYPALDASGSAAHKRTSVQNSADGPRVEQGTESFSLGLAASYELDLWGRVRSEREAETLRAQASRDDVEAAAMTLTASVADTWVNIVGTRAELAVLEQQIAVNQDLVTIELTRYANALSSGLDVLQQQEVLVAAQSEQPPLLMEAQTLRNELAVLLGSLPGVQVDKTLKLNESTVLPPLPPLPLLGLPANLLQSRPDIRGAWARLSAAQFDHSAAQANRLPALRLTAGASYNAADNALLFSNWLVNLAAGMTAPLFDGGRLSAEADRAKAVIDEKIQTYGKTVATALQEVENALTRENKQQALLQRLEERLALSIRARDEARSSYLGGRDSFLRYITQLQSVQSLERRMVRERVTLIRYRIALYRALGGDWPRTLQDQVL